MTAPAHTPSRRPTCVNRDPTVCAHAARGAYRHACIPQTQASKNNLTPIDSPSRAALCRFRAANQGLKYIASLVCPANPSIPQSNPGSIKDGHEVNHLPCTQHSPQILILKTVLCTHASLFKYLATSQGSSPFLLPSSLWICGYVKGKGERGLSLRKAGSTDSCQPWFLITVCVSVGRGTEDGSV